MKKRIKKLFPVKIEALAYYLPKKPQVELMGQPFEIKIFTTDSLSGIKKIDLKLNKSNSCYAVFINNELAHTTWLFKNKLLTNQLGEKNVFTVGDSLTNEKFRGKGIYPYVLRYISMEAERPVIIYVDESNISSIKGIEKAGFIKKYSFSMLRLLGIKIWSNKYAAEN
jgi:hypothetical protein